MARVFLSIGSNIDPEVHFQQCATALQANFSNPAWSPVYRSPAVGMEGDDFLNAVVVAQTDQSIETTVELLKQIEHEHGRIRGANKFTSRTLDIDLLLYDNVILDTAEITLPRTEITTAAHVLKPLADIEPQGVHPVLEKNYEVLLRNLEREQPGCITSLSLVSINLET